MGTTIEARNLAARQELFRLLIYVKADAVQDKAISVNKSVAEQLLKLKPSRRTMQLEKCFLKAIASLPEESVIKDIDVLFNPDYKVDVIKLLISANKQRAFSIIWPGEFRDGKLIYSEENYPDYKSFPISDYDIYCVI